MNQLQVNVVIEIPVLVLVLLTVDIPVLADTSSRYATISKPKGIINLFYGRGTLYRNLLSTLMHYTGTRIMQCPSYMSDVFVDGYLNVSKTVHHNISYLHSNSKASKLLKFIISKRVLKDCWRSQFRDDNNVTLSILLV